MFDGHIKYFAYDNIEGDDFGVGYLGNKDWWVSIINRWNLNDGIDTRYTLEDWDELNIDDFRGLKLAEIVPDGDDYIATWSDDENDNSVQIDKKYQISWLENNTKNTSVPRWVTRMKNTIREANLE